MKSSQPNTIDATGESGGVAQIRSEFPILSREVYPQVPLAYLDNAATTQKPQVVIDSLLEHYTTRVANVHRGLHRLAEAATEAYEAARGKVADFIGARSSQEVVFTRGTTEGINTVAWSLARSRIRADHEILVSEMEHHSNLVPWQQVAEFTGATLRCIPITDDGLLDMPKFEAMVGAKTSIVAVTAVSNVLGTINPIRRIAEIAHGSDALVLVDAAQSVGHMPCDVSAWNCDFLTFSGHKICGPDGIGALYGKSDLLESLPPFLTGGEMVKRVEFDRAEWNEPPWKFEAGTPPIAAAVGLGAAVDFLNRIGIEPIQQYCSQLTKYAHSQLNSLSGIRILGPAVDERGSILSFTVAGIHAHDLAQILDRTGVAVRAGHHCAQPLHQRLGITASARASLYFYNTNDEIDRLIEGIQRAQALFENRSRKQSPTRAIKT